MSRRELNFSPIFSFDSPISFVESCPLKAITAVIKASPTPLNPLLSDPTSPDVGKAGDRWLAIRQQLSQVENEQNLFTLAVQGIQQAILADRVLLYRFKSPSQGEVVAETCKLDWTPMLSASIPALFFGREVQSKYSEVVEIQLIGEQSSPVTPYQLQLLEHYQVLRSVAIPIGGESEIWGLLVIQQCAQDEGWSLQDISWLEQIGTELAMRLQVLALRSQIQNQAHYTQTATQIASRLMERVQKTEDLRVSLVSTLHELRQLLEVDRVAIYRFNADGGGNFTQEAYGTESSNWAGVELPQRWQTHYQTHTQNWIPQQLSTWVFDTPGLQDSDSAIALILHQFQVQSSAIAPIFRDGQLWGLLGAYQSQKAHVWTEFERGCLSQISSQVGLALQQAESLQVAQQQRQQLEQIADQEEFMLRFVDRIHKSQRLDTILNITTQDLRQLLGTDRVVIYRFNLNGSGQFISESVASGWRSILGTAWSAPIGNCQALTQLRTEGIMRVSHETRLLAPTQVQTHAHEFCVDDILASQLPGAYVDLIESLGARSYLLTALYVGNRLWGFLGAYHNAAVRHWQPSDRKLIHQVGTQLAIAIQQSEQTELLAQAAEHEKALSRIYNKIRRSLDIPTAFSTTTQEVRQILEADRVVVYRFNSDWSGTFVAESVVSGWQSALNQGFAADLAKCPSLIQLQQEGETLDQSDPYSRRKLHAGFCVDDIYEMDFPSHYIEALDILSARAYLITPLFLGNKLWGLLAVYQNGKPRKWSIQETKLLDNIGAQFSTALQQAVALEKVQSQSQLLTEAAEREKAAKEMLQRHAIQVLMSVRPAFDGDLTVRAPVTEDEVGTIADAYNNTLQSLRRIVMQVQDSTANLAATSNRSEQAISDLARQAQFQFQALLRTLDQIQDMADTTEAVTSNAQQVEQAVQRANETVQIGDRAMNRTVDGILGIRETVAETGKKIKRLSESSQKISRVVNVINNFTSQTQLLALNASIEATRAGEYGRGFSVVADEVRSLARQSAVATTEIEKLVQEIQREMIEVSAAMELGIEQVVNGTNLVQETRQSLNAIVSSTEEISQLVVGITQAATDQTSQSQSLAETMAELAMTANQTSEEAVQISTSFQTLLHMAENLQTSVGKFKVN